LVVPSYQILGGSGFGPTDAEPAYDTSLGDRHHRTRCSARKPGRSERLTAGSVAGQLAKFDGARVVGSAGGAEKCALLTDRLGFDAAVDHRADDWAAQLAAATPDGIDYFENVGGEHLPQVEHP
jgi:hypothetical protein